MKLHSINYNTSTLDVIVSGKERQIKAELDVRNNDKVRIGDRYIARGDGYATVLRVIDFEYADSYDNLTARQTNAMREGVVSSPNTRTAQETFQRKLAVMQVEGELWDNGQRTVGANRLPERLTPVHPISDDTLERFAANENGNVALGLLKSSSRVLDRVARIEHNFAGDRGIIFGMPGKGKSQLTRGIISQLMVEQNVQDQSPVGVLVLDRAGEYVQDTKSQDNHIIYGLQHHPEAPNQLVIVSRRKFFSEWAKQKTIAAYFQPTFNIQDIAPIDLVDFYPGFTPTQRSLLRDYAHDSAFYKKLLKETKLGHIDKSNWYRDFPGLFELTQKGKKVLKSFEQEAKEGDELNDEQLQSLEDHLSGTKSGVLERAILGIKRFAQNPFFGAKRRATDILNAASCVDQVIAHLQAGHTVVIDLRGVSNDDYTLISALFTRKLIDHNKGKNDADQIRSCIVMEEVQNILAEKELYKGEDARGSVFIEFAREGRKLKLGFLLVTQQPDPRSVASEIAWTIDSVIAFHMPPDNAKYLSRLKSSFNQFDYYLANAQVFEGIAVVAGRAIVFRSNPITPNYMVACANNQLNDYLPNLVSNDDQPTASQSKDNQTNEETIESRLSRLLHQRNRNFQRQMKSTLKSWRTSG